MAFIPIDAKADILGSKKGKITPAQHAQVNAWCLAKKTGILDCLGKCTAKANSYTVIDGVANVVFNSGYVVICGRLVECEEGTTVAVNAPTTGTVSGRILIVFNLGGAGEEEFKVIARQGTSALKQEDLNTKSKDGVYEFELYGYTATYSSITLTRTDTNYVPDLGGKFSQFEKSLTAEGKPLGGYDTSKGTIEERLTSLGFKSPVFTNVNTTYVNTGYKGYSEGNFTALKIPLKSFKVGTDIRDLEIMKISNINYPNNDLYFEGPSGALKFKITLKTNGSLMLTATNSLVANKWFYPNDIHFFFNSKRDDDFNVVYAPNFSTGD